MTYTYILFLSECFHIIATGNKLPRGIATISSVLSYCGKPFTMLEDGAMRTIIGWRGMKEVSFPGVGPRLLSHCNVPDLQLLPARYPSLRTVRFRAGMELKVFGYGLYLLSGLAPVVDFARSVATGRDDVCVCV